MNLRTYKGVLPKVGERAYIDQTAVVIGDVVIGDDCSIWPLAVLRGDVNYIRVGNCSNIQDGSVLHVTHRNKENPAGYPLLIGDAVTIGHNVTLHGCTIGNQVLVGMSSTILDGAILEDNVMLGAGSLVSPGKRLEGGYLWVGAPAKKIRELNEDELTWLKKSADHYVALKDEYF